MKKFIIALMFLVLTSQSAPAATSADVYLRQDVFNAKMDAFMAEIKLMNQDLRLELKQDISELTKAVAVLAERTDRNFDTLSARIDGVNIRIDDLRNGLYLWLVVIGTFIAWPKAKEFLQNRYAHKKSLTLEDVERLIDARLNSRTQV